MPRFCIIVCVFVTIFASVGKTDESSPWNVHGTVRDTEGKPVNDVWFSLDTGFTGRHGAMGPHGYGHPIAVQTDNEGNYNIPIPPLEAFSTMEPNEEPDMPPRAVAFRFMQLDLQPHRHFTMDNLRVVEKSRSASGDIIVVGDVATPEDVAALKKRFAEENYDVIFVEKNRPCRIDFVVEPKPEASNELQQILLAFRREKIKELPKDFIPPSWYGQPNYWVGKTESDRRYKMFRKLIVPYSMNTAYKEALELTDKISVSLRFPKPEIMVGEPIHFDYVVRNNSDVEIHITVGGDYRNSTGRPESFTMRAVRKDGGAEKIVYQIPEIFGMGGWTHPQKLAANGGEYVFDLCLPCWLDITEPGEYRIDVARHLESAAGDCFSRAQTIPLVLRTASGTLTVKPVDHDAFGKLIDDLGERATVTVPENIDYKERDKRLEERTKAREKLDHIKDERAIPWFNKIAATDPFKVNPVIN